MVVATGAAGIQGNAGPQGVPGLTGATGPRGEAGPSASAIPFSVSNGTYGQGVEISSDTQGDPLIIVFAGFGSTNDYYVTQLQPGDWDAGSYTISQEGSYPDSFIMPYNATLSKVHVLFANRNDIFAPEGVQLRPFACLAVSDGNNLTFTILQETITFTQPYDGGSPIPSYSLRKGVTTGLNVPIAEGSLVSIVLGWVGEGPMPDYNTRISASGGLYFE